MNTDIPGDLIVSEEVLADIAGHAALQCVIVSVDEDGVLISLYVVLEHGVNINVVSTNLVDQVTFALEEFVQAPLKGIDVHVQGIKVR